MNNRAIEILALKLAQAEANLAILQAQLEQAQREIEQLREGQQNSVQTDI